MKVISLVNQKGGVGKSTISLNLAYCFASALRVGLIDIDPQGTIRNIQNALNNINLLSINDLSNSSSLPFDVIIVDTPPYLSNHLSNVLQASDLVLVPIKPSYVDIMAVKPVVDIIYKEQKGESFEARFILNMVKPRTSVNQDVINLLQDMPIKVMKTMLSERVAFIRSFVSNGVFEGDDERAAKEVVDLTAEIIGIIGL